MLREGGGGPDARYFHISAVLFQLEYKTISMKKNLVIVLVLSLAVLGARAQAKARVGLCLGLNESSYKESFQSNEFTSDWKTGLHAGVFGELPLSGRFGLEADLLYSQKGGVDPGDTSMPKISIRLNYLTLPVLLNFYITPKLAVQAGPEIGLLLVARAHSGDYTATVHDVYRSFETGVAGGIFYQLPRGLSVGVRYIQGFKPITKPLQFTNSLGGQVGVVSIGNNRTAQLTVHYVLWQKKG